MEPKTFDQRTVNKIFGHIHVNTLRFWALEGLYGWINEVEDKRGISREYDINNLYQIGVVENLSSLDVRMDVIKMIMQNLGKNPSMDKIIFISKHPYKSKETRSIGDKLRKSPKFSWHHLIIKPGQLNGLIEHYRKDFGIAVIIVVDLAAVKVFVDSLIK